MYTTPCPNRKLHGLADHVPSMLASWDSDLRCRFANRAYKDWFGVDPRAMLGTSIQGLLGPRLFQMNEPYMRRALAGEEQVFERFILGPEGVGRHSLARYTPEFDDGSVVGFFVEVTDVTALKVAEAALQREVESLAKLPRRRSAESDDSVEHRRSMIQDVQHAASLAVEADAARQGAFLAQLAHEMRNFLGPIQAGAAVLGRSIEGPEPMIAKVCSMMSRQVGHMSRLVDDLLDFASIEAGIFSMAKLRLDLRNVIREALEISKAEDAGHSVTVTGVDFPLMVDADHTRLVQVFANLLNNAVKYTPRGGRIALRAVREMETVKVQVQDNGVGMAAGTSDSVFHLFAQLPDSAARRQGGLGIGLALVRKIVHAHQGSVTASSEGPGQGSTFTVCLPTASERQYLPRAEST